MPSSAFMKRFRAASLVISTALGMPAGLLAQHEIGGTNSFQPKIVAASDEGEKAIRKFSVAEGLKVELWAAEPDVAQGVALHMDNRGRMYVAETFRHHRGVTDIRGIMSWLDEDLACRTVDDRLAMMKRNLGPKIAEYSTQSERLRMLVDPSKTGRAVKSTVFAEGFNSVLDGIAAGVLTRGNNVYFANIPHVWKLNDHNNDGVADERTPISSGHGARVGFLGHDLHGLAWGPDGRLYFSIGDRASYFFAEGHWVGTPDTGAVFRCQPDGSEIEMFAYGLRNPQELVFDDQGNLFTGENNSDGGDQARWVHLVEGGDSGWRIGWQYLEKHNAPNARGPWNSEKMWHPKNPEQPAYIVPPLKNLGAGPSGVAFYPGTGWSEKYQGTFLLVDFRGSASGSGIHQFKLRPKGASFEVTDENKLIWSILATDAEFGPDGYLYVLDWVQGWDQNGKGRIYKISDTQNTSTAIVSETQQTLAEGVTQKPVPELLKLLAHANQRVRQEAQFELASRGASTIPVLQELASSGQGRPARLHALWALGQISHSLKGARNPAGAAAIENAIALLGDPDPVLRWNAARILGDARHPKAFDGLVKLTADSDLAARAQAAIALGKLGRREALPAIFAMLRENADQDPVVRHAGVMGLVGIKDLTGLAAGAKDPSESVRMGVLLAMRRLANPDIALFLKDSSERIVTEAARAISDEPISGAIPELAALLRERNEYSQPLGRRVLNANYRFGTRETAETLATFASTASANADLRAEAISSLADWPRNSGRDRVTGMWRPTAMARDAAIPAQPLKSRIASLILDGPDKVRSAAAKASTSLHLIEAVPALAQVVEGRIGDGASRADALNALAALDPEKGKSAAAKAADDPSEVVRSASIKLGGGGSAGDDATSRLTEIVTKGSRVEKQAAFAKAAEMPGAAADAWIAGWVQQLIDGKAPAEIQLDILEAAAKRTADPVKSLVAKYEAGLKKDAQNDMSSFRVCLEGGNAEEGKKIFLERAEVSCVRCHKVDGEGGEVGPELNGLVGRQNREYILQSILYPNVTIAKGFENVIISLKSGTQYAGLIKAETDSEVELLSPEDGLMKLKKSEITMREKGASGMPEGFAQLLTRPELRNLLEYIATLK